MSSWSLVVLGMDRREHLDSRSLALPWCLCSLLTGVDESHILLVQGGRWGTVEALQAHRLEAAFCPFHKQADGAGSANFLPYMRARAVTVMGGVLPT